MLYYHLRLHLSYLMFKELLALLTRRQQRALVPTASLLGRAALVLGKHACEGEDRKIFTMWNRQDSYELKHFQTFRWKGVEWQY